MKAPLALRIDPDLLAATRECARRDSRSLTNFIETALRERIARMASDSGGGQPGMAAADKETTRAS